jgi:hypothetical protein
MSVTPTNDQPGASVEVGVAVAVPVAAARVAVGGRVVSVGVADAGSGLGGGVVACTSVGVAAEVVEGVDVRPKVAEGVETAGGGEVGVGVAVADIAAVTGPGEVGVGVSRVAGEAEGPGDTKAAAASTGRAVGLMVAAWAAGVGPGLTMRARAMPDKSTRTNAGAARAIVTPMTTARFERRRGGKGCFVGRKGPV